MIGGHFILEHNLMVKVQKSENLMNISLILVNICFIYILIKTTNFSLLLQFLYLIMVFFKFSNLMKKKRKRIEEKIKSLKKMIFRNMETSKVYI